MQNSAARIFSRYLSLHYHIIMRQRTLRGLIWSGVEILNSMDMSLRSFLFTMQNHGHHAKAWPASRAEIAKTRTVKTRGERNGKSGPRTKDKCALESDVRTSSNCKTVLFDPDDTRAHGIQREKRASTRVPRAYICRRGGGISQDDVEGRAEGREEDRGWKKGLSRGSYTNLPALKWEGFVGLPRGTFSRVWRPAI